MTRKSIYFAVTTLLLFGVPTISLAQSSSRTACQVTITSPRVGETHGATVMVTGRAEVDSGRSLFVFARRKGLQVTWPQGGGAALIEPNGEFNVLVTLGESRDAGAEFIITAQLVERPEAQRLETWFRQSEASGKYPGISMPPFAPGCGVPPSVTVLKGQ